MRQRREHYYEPQSILESQFELLFFFFFLSLGNRMLSNSLPTPGCCFVQLVRSLLTVETAFPCPMPAGRRQDSWAF